MSQISFLCVRCVCLEEDFPDPMDESGERNNKPGRDLITVLY